MSGDASNELPVRSLAASSRRYLNERNLRAAGVVLGYAQGALWLVVAYFALDGMSSGDRGSFAVAGRLAFVSAAVMIPWTAIAFALDRVVAAERAGGFTTVGRSWLPRPEVARGTSIVIRAAGEEPLTLAERRTLTRWARVVADGGSAIPPSVARATTPSTGSNLLDPWRVAVRVGVSAFAGAALGLIASALFGAERSAWPLISAFVAVSCIAAALAVRPRALRGGAMSADEDE